MDVYHLSWETTDSRFAPKETQRWCTKLKKGSIVPNHVPCTKCENGPKSRNRNKAPWSLSNSTNWSQFLRINFLTFGWIWSLKLVVMLDCFWDFRCFKSRIWWIWSSRRDFGLINSSIFFSNSVFEFRRKKSFLKIFLFSLGTNLQI